MHRLNIYSDPPTRFHILCSMVPLEVEYSTTVQSADEIIQLRMSLVSPTSIPVIDYDDIRTTGQRAKIFQLRVKHLGVDYQFTRNIVQAGFFCVTILTKPPT